MSEAKKSFIYVTGDAAKTPVNPKTQPLGTKLTLVTLKGREMPMVAGKSFENDKAKRADSFSKLDRSVRTDG
jgi:hypothetical protein